MKRGTMKLKKIVKRMKALGAFTICIMQKIIEIISVSPLNQKKKLNIQIFWESLISNVDHYLEEKNRYNYYYYS